MKLNSEIISPNWQIKNYKDTLYLDYLIKIFNIDKENILYVSKLDDIIEINPKIIISNQLGNGEEVYINQKLYTLKSIILDPYKC